MTCHSQQDSSGQVIQLIAETSALNILMWLILTSAGFTAEYFQAFFMKMWDRTDIIMTRMIVGKQVMRWEMELAEQCIPSELQHYYH